MRRRGLGWFGAFALAMAATSCAPAGAPDETVTVQSAVNSNVVVTVVNDSGTPQVDVEVMAQQSGSFVKSAWTNAQGKATLSLAAGSYRFATEEAGVFYYSGAAGHCTTPACTTASITMTHVDVNVVDTNGSPKAGLLVSWFDTAGNGGAYVVTGANGHASVSVPPASYRFKVSINGLHTYSGEPGHCTVPSCTSATITVTVPVTVTVTDTAGAPIANKVVEWENAAGAGGAWTSTNASGQAQVSVPAGSTRFEVVVDGTSFFSSSGFSCVVPGCTSASILVSTPTVVTVVDGAGAPVSGKAVTPLADEAGITANNKTTNASGQATFRLPFAHWRFRATCAANSEQFFSGNAGHCLVSGCTTARITMPCGQCTGQTNGTTCNDQNPCTGTSTCQNQKCTGANPMNCTAGDACHEAGACSAETASCSGAPKANGTSCNDNNACTGTSSCQAGVCTGSNPVTCTASDQCHAAGTCNPATGACSNPAVANGTSCNDGSLCTQTDTCQSGTCTGGSPVTCTASDQCHSAGTCNPATGACSNPTVANGTSCNDGSLCTQTDTCQSGTCAGGNPVACAASDQCHAAGTCNPATGTCSNPIVANGTSCNDGSLCTQADTCQAGTCTGGNPVTCTASDQCHAAGTCNPSTGACSNPTVANGTSCNDGSLCTQTDTCQSGTCTGGNPVTCTAQNQCHTSGTCDPTTGACSNPVQVDGFACSDGDSCTSGEMCENGICTGGTPSCAPGALALTNLDRSVGASQFMSTGPVSTDHSDIAPADPVVVSTTVTNSGLSFTLQADLDGENTGTASMVIGAVEMRLEYFSTAQNQWLPIAFGGIATNGGPLPRDPLSMSASTSARGPFGQQVTYPIFGIPQTIIAPGATAHWGYFFFASVSPAAAAAGAAAAQTSSVRFLLRVNTTTPAGGSAETAIDMTALFATLSPTPLADRVTLNAALDSGAPVAMSPAAPITPGQASVVYSATVVAPTEAARSAFASDTSYLLALAADAVLPHTAVVRGALSGIALPAKTLALSSAIPVVHSGVVNPPSIVAGQPVHYGLQFRNDGTGSASAVSAAHLFNGDPLGSVVAPASLAVGQTATGSVDFTAPGDPPLADQVIVTWNDRNGNLYGPITQTPASCPAATCDSITVGGTQVNLQPRPRLTATIATDVNAPLMPGDPFPVTGTVKNAGVDLVETGPDGILALTNTGFAPFTVLGYRQTYEYLSLSEQTWKPFARFAVGADGGPVPETTLLQLGWQFVGQAPGGHDVTYSGGVAGTSIAPGGLARWSFRPSTLLLPPGVLAPILDAAEGGGVRSVVQFDVSVGPPPEPTILSLDTTFAGLTGNVDDVGLYVEGGTAGIRVPVTMTSAETGPLTPGATRSFAGQFAVPVYQPGGPGDPLGASYLQILQTASNEGIFAEGSGTGHASPLNPTSSEAFFGNYVLQIPVVTPRKSGPAQSSAGLTAPYTIGLTNTGKANASSVTVTDTIDGAPVDLVSLVVPPLVAVSRTEFATFSAASSPARPAGPLTDVATITWRDIRGNLYGPVSSAFTTELAAARAEGYLFVSGGTSSPDIVGASKALTAMAIDASGHPVAGVTVHFTVTGINPQTTDLTTGADGTASFVYTSAALGTDAIVASATVTTTPIQSDPVSVQWASAIGTPCTGRRTPLDIMLVVDVSPSMVLEPPKLAFGGSAGKLEAAQAAGDRFIDDLTYPLDHIGVVTFMGDIVSSAPLGTDTANVKAQLDGGIGTGILCTGIICVGGSDVAHALNVALDELESPRRRPDATKVIVYIGDGGADVDPTAAIARLRASGARALAIGLGSNFDGLMSLVPEIADSPNDYFYSPSGAGIDFAFNSLNQDLCRNRAPYVSAGGDYGAYSVRLPSPLTLQGEVHDDGSEGDQRLMSEWTLLSGPASVSIVNPTSPVTDVLFFEPGTYTFQLTASDGYLTVADRATITVDPDPSIIGASLAVALSAPGPLETGQAETLTATLLDGLGAPIRNFVVTATVAGANPAMTTLITDNAGVATFTYRGAKSGTDVIHATAIGSTLHLDSANVSVQWVQPATGGPVLTQGWIGAPTHQDVVMGRVSIALSPNVTLASGTVTYAPTSAPTDVHTLASNVSGAPDAVIATFDTTLVANDSYVIQLAGTDQSGNQKTSTVLVTVTGDYKPGRVVVEMTDLTVPIAGLPITIGRRYDSLEKDKVGDFGHGWSLSIGHPRVEMNPDYGVTLTLPNGRRATFGLTVAMKPEQILAGPFNPFPGVYFPAYQAEPGVFGTLTQEGGCPAVRYNPSNPDNPIPCFFTFGFVPDNRYAPEFFTYTDPYGTAYRMAASGELKSITDRQGNRLSFEANGIISSTGRSVTWERDAEGRITKVDYPALFGPYQDAANYTYNAAGDLVQVTLAPANNAGQEIFKHTYAEHRLLTTVDPRGSTASPPLPARTSTYYPDGRLQSDKDALNNETTYAYDLETKTTTTRYPDEGELVQKFDARGLLLSETDQLGHTTTHEYDPDRNETKRTNALGEETTAIYEGPNQVSVKDPTGTTHTTYGDDNLPTTFKDRLDHVTTIEYDDRHVPKRFADELGTRFRFTNSEQGLPLTIDDAEGHRAYLNYDVAGNVTSRTDWLGRETRATYDEGGRRVTETSARGAVSRNVYIFGFGRLGSAIQPNGYSTEHSYDANGNLLVDYDLPGPPGFHGSNNRTYNALNQITQVLHNPEQTTVTYERDFRGNPLTMTDENGHTTTYEYDLAGQLKKTTFADGTFTTRTYDELNRLASVTDERGNTTTYEYDEGCGCSDRVTRVTDPLGHATVTAYDANGRRSSVTDANGHATSFVYDVRGHVIETHYADSTSTSETYDSRGRRTSMTDQTGATTLYGYDDQGQLTSVTDPLSNVTHYAYDLDGNLTSVTDANGHTTSYAYDLMKRKTKRTLPMGQFETFKYDLAGRLTEQTEFSPAGTNCAQTPSPCKTTTMTYDSRDRILTKAPDPSRGEATHVYTYWPNGLRKTATNASGATTYTYDERDRMLTKVTTADTSTYGLTYTYDDTGNVATIRSSNTKGTSVDYLWNAANQLVSVTDNRVGGTTTATYTPTNRPATLAQPNGVGLTYSYDDPMDRVTSMLWRQGSLPPFGSWAYTHNERGQRLTSTDVTGRIATYTFDTAARLASETITNDPRGASFNGALSYVLDGAGNRTSLTSTLAAITSATASYNANDELDADTYDANGNTLTSGGHAYAYDFENRLVSKDSGAVTVAYDCDGTRVSKTVGGVTTRYLVDDLNATGYLQVLEEIVGGAVQTRYTYGDRIVSQTRNVSATPATSYYGFDAHGNITFLTDLSGTVTDSYDYDAWGVMVAGTGSTQNSRLYAGEEFDPDLGLINLRARHYRPRTGRLLAIDPEPGTRWLPVTMNRYLYANGDPVNLLDPTGRAVAIELAAINVLQATLYTVTIVAVGYMAGCNLVFAISAFDTIDNANSVPAMWQWCAKGGKKNIENEYVPPAREQPDPCAWLEGMYRAARRAGDSKMAQKIKTAQKALGCRGSSYN